MNLFAGWYFTGLTSYDWLMVDASFIALTFTIIGVSLIRSR